MSDSKAIQNLFDAENGENIDKNIEEIELEIEPVFIPSGLDKQLPIHRPSQAHSLYVFTNNTNTIPSYVKYHTLPKFLNSEIIRFKLN